MMGKWLEEIPLMRGFAILSVVLIHTSVSFSQINGHSLIVIINLALCVLSNFGVPLFVLISGIVLANGYWGTYDLKKFYLKRMQSVIPQYFSYSIFYILFRVLFLSVPLTIFLIVYDLGTGSAYFQLWFFMLIIQLYLLYPVIEKIYKWCENRFWAGHFLLGCLIIQLFYMIFRDVIVYILRSWHYSGILNSMLVRLFPQYLFYFVLGIYVIRNLENIRTIINKISLQMVTLGVIISGGITAIVALHDHIYFGNLYSSPIYYILIEDFICIILFLFTFVLIYKLCVMMIKERTPSLIFFNLMGKYSYGIFLIHSFYLTVIGMILSLIAITYTDWTYYPIAFAGTIIFSYTTSWFIENIITKSLHHYYRPRLDLG